MRTIKPLRLAVLPRTYEHLGRGRLAVSIAFFFPLQGEPVLLPEMSFWKLVAEELGTSTPLDECMPKKYPEVLLFGSAFAPGGVPTVAVRPRVRFGSVDKVLTVVGDRRWQRGGVASAPEPFASMPLDWSRAFGGEGFPKNPRGRGFANGAETVGLPLPNVERTDDPVKGPKDAPEPAGFGPIPLDWPQRMTKVGTYDQAWLDQDFPGLPKDLDWSFFNVASPDQRLAALRGDETFVLEHLHATEPRIEGRLPAARARCFLNQRRGDELVFREVEMKPDTVIFFPHRLRAVVYWRGSIEVAEDDAADVVQLLAAAEANDEPRDTDHYRRAMAERSDEKTRHLYALRDLDLVSARLARPSGLPDDQLSDTEALLAREGLLEKNLRNKAQRALDEARARIVALGRDPGELGLPEALPEPESPPKLEDLPELGARLNAELAEKKLEAEQARAAAEKAAREQCAALELDYDALVKKGQSGSAGPPKFRAEEELARLRDQAELAQNAGVPLPEVTRRLADPGLEAGLVAAERALVEMYRKHAQFQPAAERLGEDASAVVRARVVRDRASGASLAGVDLTGADLSGLDLRGVDFEGALMENVSLRGADLEGANLSTACLARADLSEASLVGTRLRDANLAASVWAGVKGARGADLRGADLSYADLRDASLTGAQLTGARLFEVRVENARFCEIVGEKLAFVKTNLRGASFDGARIDGAVFLECDVSGVSFAKASLVEAAFVSTRGVGASFCEATVTNLRAVKDTDFSEANFSGCVGEGSNFRGTKLVRANFERARLDQSDVSDCDATEANFRRATAAGSLFIRTVLRGATFERANLPTALLQKADLKGADFSGANLFRADLARVRGDKASRFEDANMDQIRFVRRREEG